MLLPKPFPWQREVSTPWSPVERSARFLTSNEDCEKCAVSWPRRPAPVRRTWSFARTSNGDLAGSADAGVERHRRWVSPESADRAANRSRRIPDGAVGDRLHDRPEADDFHVRRLRSPCIARRKELALTRSAHQMRGERIVRRERGRVEIRVRAQRMGGEARDHHLRRGIDVDCLPVNAARRVRASALCEHPTTSSCNSIRAAACSPPAQNDLDCRRAAGAAFAKSRRSRSARTEKLPCTTTRSPGCRPGWKRGAWTPATTLLG